MNGKKAKQLRRQAESATVGMPKAKCTLKDRGLKPYLIDSVDLLGMPCKKKIQVRMTQTQLIPACTRSVYKLLKRIYRS